MIFGCRNTISSFLVFAVSNWLVANGAMKLVRNVLGSERAAAVLDTAYDHLRKGKSLLDPLVSSGLFPPVLVNMLRVGEETGSLTQSLLHMADMFEDKLDTTVQRTLTILEPVIILLVSGFVALLIISIKIRRLSQHLNGTDRDASTYPFRHQPVLHERRGNFGESERRFAAESYSCNRADMHGPTRKSGNAQAQQSP